NALTLRLYDVLTGKELWKQTFALNETLLRSEDPDLAGAIEPGGVLRVIDLQTRKEVLTARLRPEHLERVQSVHLLADAHHFYAACHLPPDPNLVAWNGVQSNLLPQSGLRSLPVIGAVYAFERTAGRLLWRADVPNQHLVLEQF